MIYDYFVLITYGYSFYKTISYSFYIKNKLEDVYSYYYYFSFIPTYFYKITSTKKSKTTDLDINFDEWVLLEKKFSK